MVMTIDRFITAEKKTIKTQYFLIISMYILCHNSIVLLNSLCLSHHV